MAWLPSELPATLDADWQKDLPSEGLGGIAADTRYVVLGCRDGLDQSDVFLCVDAATGNSVWQLEYPAPGTLDYGNTPRATPLIVGDSVMLLGAFGDLHCVDLESGAILWKKNLVRDFGGEVPIWGFCGTPLAVDNRVILQTSAPQASLIALDFDSGDVVWQSPGRPCSYASLILAKPGAVPQVIGFDQSSLGAWSVEDGHRLFEITPDEPNDFNVPTPLVDESGFVVATENNGARRFRFSNEVGQAPAQSAAFADFSPDTHTPVQVGDRIFGVHGEFYCLHAKSLRPIWTGSDDAFAGHTSIVASADRVLVITARGELLLIDATSDDYRLISRAQLSASDIDVFSHPAFVNQHLFIRLGKTLARVSLVP